MKSSSMNRAIGWIALAAIAATAATAALAATDADRQYCEQQQGGARIVCLRDLDKAPAASPAPAPTAAPATPEAPTTGAAVTQKPATPQAAGAAPYKVVDGFHVDATTYKGFQTWRAAACDRCHGANQQGLVGPSLIESLKSLSKDDFVRTVTNGRLEKGMPSFKTSDAVMANLDPLYAYLKGRSDGAITKAHVDRIE